MPSPAAPVTRPAGLLIAALALSLALLATADLPAPVRGQDPLPLLAGAPAPELDPGAEWLGVKKPLRLRDLRGKFVILDFWTFCCINCIHLFPDLERLEKKYPRQLVIVGVHSPKFDAEKDTAAVRKAMQRYGLHHPVVCDFGLKITRAYQSSAWPTVVLIDPEGDLVGKISSEKVFAEMDRTLSRLIPVHRARKTLNEKPLPFQTEARTAPKDGPLLFPGDVLADEAGNRLFITDSGHHRIVITDLAGKKVAVAGTGKEGRSDGPFDAAEFADPQGLALDGDTLYVADRKNNLIRALNLKTQTVTTVAGTGKQGRDRRRGGAALLVGLNSPWGLLAHKGKLFVGMAGHHQIWVMDLATSLLAPFAGTGKEALADGPRHLCRLAQPSGLGSDGDTLYVADSESSAVRAVGLDGRTGMRTLVGRGLFVWGDRDGKGSQARLQHPLDVVWHDGKLYVADSYNHKIKVINPLTRECTTLNVEGEADERRHFDEPGGLSIAGDYLYVADTNAGRIRVVDLMTGKVSTLDLQDAAAP